MSSDFLSKLIYLYCNLKVLVKISQELYLLGGIGDNRILSVQLLLGKHVHHFPHAGLAAEFRLRSQTSARNPTCQGWHSRNPCSGHWLGSRRTSPGSKKTKTWSTENLTWVKNKSFPNHFSSKVLVKTVFLLTSIKSDTPRFTTPSWISWSVVHQVRLPTYSCHLNKI